VCFLCFRFPWYGIPSLLS